VSFKRFAVGLVRFGLLALALLVTAGISTVTTMRAILASQEVVVPSLLDKRIPEAGAVAARHRLLLRVEGKKHDPKVPAEHIVAQEPGPGSTLKAHRSVRVWTSLGPKRLRLPGVEGASLRTARLDLDQAQVPIHRVVEVDDPAEEGTVLVQQPPAGDTDSLQEGVSLLVSRGRGGTDYLMPDLIGRRADLVLDDLRRAGLKVSEIRYRSYPGVAPGIVLRQVPAAGHRVSPRTALSVDISRAMP
jgi:beta-lactam-binding protein with PASTA domain